MNQSKSSSKTPTTTTNTKHNHSSSGYDNNYQMKQINQQKVKKLGKCFNIIDSPQIVFDLCDKAYKRSRQKQLNNMYFITTKPQLTKTLLQQRKKQLKRKPHHQSQSQHINNNNLSSNYTSLFIKDINQNQHSRRDNTIINNLDQRQYYSLITQRVKHLINKIQHQQGTMLSQVLILKQQILSSFLSQMIQQCNKQCRQKGQLLQFIWNSTFSIIELTMKQLVQQKHHNQKHYLKENIQNHHNYQAMLQIDKEKIAQLKDQLQRTQVLNNTLIFNSRCKRRQLRKAYIKLKVSTNKLNQYKENYLDLQRDYIDLMIETKDVSREMAEYLFKRRQEILNQKKKTFKLKFSKKTNLIKAKQELSSQNPLQLNKIKQQLKTAFNKQYDRQLAQKQQQQKQGSSQQKIKKLQNFLFQDAMDQFAYYQTNEIIDDDFMSAKTKTLFIDAETDMIGFQLDVDEKYCQVEYIDKIVHGMLRNAGQQTFIIEDKAVKKIFIDGFVQVDAKDINQKKLRQQNKLFDMSFLYQKKTNLANSMYSRKVNDTNAFNNSYCYSPFNQNRDSPFKKKQDRVSIKISNKKSKNKLQTNLSIESKNILDTQNHIHTVQSVDKCQQQDQDDKLSNISSTQNVNDYAVKFAIKKGLKKKKLFNFINGNNENQVTSQELLSSKRINSQSHGKRNSKTFRNNSLQSKKYLQNDPTQRKRLQRQLMTKNQNDISPQNNASRFKETLNNQNQQKTKIIQLITKSCKKIDFIDPQAAVNQIKHQNKILTLQNDDEIKDIIKVRQQHQKQQFFKNFYQSIKPMIDDMFKHIQVTKRYNKSLIPSRQKNLLKTISSVYLQTYKLLEKQEQIYSLINPLLRHFQVGFGALKKSQLYMKMISFLSNIYMYKQSNHIFNSFIFFTGMDRQNQLSIKITNQDFQLYLKLLKKLSFNFDMTNSGKNFNVQNLFTSDKIIQKYTRQVFDGSNINQTIVGKIINKVYQKLQRTTGIDLRQKSVQKQNTSKLSLKFNKNTGSSQTNRSNTIRPQSKLEQKITPTATKEEYEQEIKLDVFFCTQSIMQQLMSVKKSLQESYMPLINHVYQQQKQVEEYRVDETLIKFIIGCQFESKFNEVKCYQVLSKIFKINSLYDQYKTRIVPSSKSIKTHRTLKTIKFIDLQYDNNWQNQKQRDTLSLSEMCSFFLKTNISDLNKTYYNALSMFKIKEQTAYNMFLRKINQIKSYFELNHYQIESILLYQITKDQSFQTISSPLKLNNLFTPSLTSNFNSSKNSFFSSNLQKQQTSGMTLKQVHNKKLLILCLFKYLQAQTNSTFQNIIGKDLLFLNNYLPTLKSKI